VTSGRASPYLLDNAAAQAGERFAALSAAFDPITFGHLDALRVGPTCSCWEVGAGGPSVPAWLAQRVGSAGRVVAIDIDTSWLDDLPANVEVRVHPPISGRGSSRLLRRRVPRSPDEKNRAQMRGGEAWPYGSSYSRSPSNSPTSRSGNATAGSPRDDDARSTTTNRTPMDRSALIAPGSGSLATTRWISP